MKSEKWVLCPVCRSKTRSRIREDTVKKTTLFTVQNVNRKQ